jgi:tetratricopeptide (TPR) repeat protein
MSMFRLFFLMIFLAGYILSGCAASVYKHPPTSPAPVYDQQGRPADTVSPESTSSSSDQQTPQPRGPYEISGVDPSEATQKPLPSPPRIGSDVHSESASPDDYLLAAVSSLEKESEELLAQGRTDKAFATAERAIRIDPTNAKLWNLLARIQLGRGNYSQAEQLSRKSNLLAKNDKRLQAENWRIIEKALREKGRPGEAEKALQKALELEKN